MSGSAAEAAQFITFVVEPASLDRVNGVERDIAQHQVRRVNAHRSVAKVKYPFPLWDRPIHQFPRITMCIHSLLRGNGEHAVAELIAGTLPVPAPVFALLDDVRPKTFNGVTAKVGIHARARAVFGTAVTYLVRLLTGSLSTLETFNVHGGSAKLIRHQFLTRIGVTPRGVTSTAGGF